MTEPLQSAVDELVRSNPILQATLDEHIASWEEVLPYLLMGDVARLLAERYDVAGTDPIRLAEIEAVLDTLDTQLGSADRDVQDLVAVGFLEQLPYPHERGAGIRSILPRQLKEEILRVTGFP